MNNQSCEARKVKPNCLEAGGDFFFMEYQGKTYLHYLLPDGSDPGAIPVVKGLASVDAWGWDGNEESPTLLPSIQCTGAINWHGWLKAGKFISC